MNILVVGPSWVGDTVLSQPLLRLLKDRHPGAQIDYLAPPWTLPLLARMPEVRAGIENPFGLAPCSSRLAAGSATRCAQPDTTRPWYCPTRSNRR